jgi:hypothetical protein
LYAIHDSALIHHDQALFRTFLLIKTFSILDPTSGASSLQGISATASRISSANLGPSHLLADRWVVWQSFKSFVLDQLEIPH